MEANILKSKSFVICGFIDDEIIIYEKCILIRFYRISMNTVYIDEVGQASIAGDLYVCAVLINDKQEKIEGVKDSKQLTRKKRNELFPILTGKLIYQLERATIREIETLNVHYAKYAAMKRVVGELAKNHSIDKVIVDGKFVIPGLNVPQEAVVKADDKYWEVGAASIIAKVYRDNVMAELAQQERYSYYDFESNCGYYSPNHRKGIILHGPCDLHRQNFMYFQYCLDRHRKYKIVGGDIDEFLSNKIIDGKPKSDYFIWKMGV